MHSGTRDERRVADDEIELIVRQIELVQLREAKLGAFVEFVGGSLADADAPARLAFYLVRLVRMRPQGQSESIAERSAGAARPAAVGSGPTGR